MKPQETTLAQLPPKQPDVHRWVAIAHYTLTPKQISAMTRGAYVDTSDLCLAITFGCWDCQGRYETVKKAPCIRGATEPPEHGAG